MSDCSAQDAIPCLGHFIIALHVGWLHNPEMTEEHEILRKKYHQFRNYREKRLKEAFEITAEEWIAYFIADLNRYNSIAAPYGTSCVSKADIEASWSVGNMVVGQQVRTKVRRARTARLADTTAIPRDARFVEANDETPRKLTKSQWIEELRAAKQIE